MSKRGNSYMQPPMSFRSPPKSTPSFISSPESAARTSVPSSAGQPRPNVSIEQQEEIERVVAEFEAREAGGNAGIDSDDVDEDLELQQVQAELEEEAATVTTSQRAKYLAHAHQIQKSSRSDNTNQQYDLWIRNWIKWAKADNDLFDPNCITVDSPADVIAFLTYKCGTKEQDGKDLTYAVAQSVRSAFTRHFAKILGVDSGGHQQWWTDGRNWTGNPSMSVQVSTFMMGLKKMKVKAGETAESARALTKATLYRLYDLLITKPERDMEAAKHRRQCAQRFFLYLVNFLCMFRTSELLDLKISGLRCLPNHAETYELVIPHRKTHQTGKVHPFVLHANHYEPVLCPVRALFRLILVRNGTETKWASPNAPLLCDIDDRERVYPSRTLTTRVVTNWLRQDLRALGHSDWMLYGTHSSRRGGAQYWHTEFGWSIPELCAWGGWSNSEAMTVVRYLWSENDLARPRHTFTDPRRNYNRSGGAMGALIRGGTSSLTVGSEGMGGVRLMEMGGELWMQVTRTDTSGSRTS